MGSSPSRRPQSGLACVEASCWPEPVLRDGQSRYQAHLPQAARRAPFTTTIIDIPFPFDSFQLFLLGIIGKYVLAIMGTWMPTERFAMRHVCAQDSEMMSPTIPSLSPACGGESECKALPKMIQVAGLRLPS